MATDTQQRLTLARVDDRTRQNSVYAARRLIYHKSYQVDSAAVERFLKETSLTPNTVCTLLHNVLDATLTLPIQNAFSCRLGPLGFNYFSMLLVDLLHEVELGVWKSLFIHLLRILESHKRDGANLVAELDRR
jgi:hypothetical protein